MPTDGRTWLGQQLQRAGMAAAIIVAAFCGGLAGGTVGRFHPPNPDVISYLEIHHEGLGPWWVWWGTTLGAPIGCGCLAGWLSRRGCQRFPHIAALMATVVAAAVAYVLTVWLYELFET